MRRPMHRGQKPRPLHESPASRSSLQWSHRNRTTPCASTPHFRKERSSFTTKLGIPSGEEGHTRGLARAMRADHGVRELLRTTLRSLPPAVLDEVRRRHDFYLRHFMPPEHLGPFHSSKVSAFDLKRREARGHAYSA
jgi:hypothetical protein